MNETQLIDAYINNTLNPDVRLVFDARLLIDADLKEKLVWQYKTYDLLQEYGRHHLKLEIKNVQQRLFSETAFESFRKKIQSLFQ